MYLEKKSFQVYNSKKQYSHIYYFQSWYSPIFLKAKNEDADNSTCITFEVRRNKEGKHHLALANILPPNVMDSHEVLIHAKNVNNDFTNNNLVGLPSRFNQSCVILPADSHGSHNTFASVLQRDNLPIRRMFIERNGGDIEGLLHQAVRVLRQDKFYLLPHPKKEHALRPIDSDFLNIVASYPDKESYALAYAWAQGLVYAEKHLYIFDTIKEDKTKKFNHGYGVERK
jgi:hypothetical protein